MQKQNRSLTIGQRFGRLVVAEAFFRDGEAWCRCVCDCGGEKVAHRSNIRRGAVKSCGCIHPHHGDAAGQKTPEYIAWKGMIARCSNANGAEFHRYGGRGIRVCEGWRLSYSRFLADMGRRPSSSHSLDRLNNDGDYEPGNCRWATRIEQERNRSTNHIIEVGDDRMPLCAWAEKTGLNRSTIWSRLRRGWSAERALAASPYARTAA